MILIKEIKIPPYICVIIIVMYEAMWFVVFLYDYMVCDLLFDDYSITGCVVCCLNIVIDRMYMIT